MELWFMEQKDKSDAFVRNIDKYIQKHLGDDLSLVTLSEKVYLNPSYLSRRYKELTGKNITDTITEARMNRAAQLLDDEQYKVRNVAEMVGFASAAHFSRVFKKHTGMTPQEYRDNSRGVG
jgi:two-component system response regulator YesN